MPRIASISRPLISCACLSAVLIHTHLAHSSFFYSDDLTTTPITFWYGNTTQKCIVCEQVVYRDQRFVWLSPQSPDSLCDHPRVPTRLFVDQEVAGSVRQWREAWLNDDYDVDDHCELADSPEERAIYIALYMQVILTTVQAFFPPTSGEQPFFAAFMQSIWYLCFACTGESRAL